ncbi:ferroptosis suppressor protein 1-like [Zingiber officinale]|uniref:ferroptosis suppressor protein 1-like n=1 Tax=Zingiber officinale TaxID=94328 RepID=UPI001C4CE241|nr:ferroptosis suppressor protein 1-like [Zingiber officinale]
MQKNSPSMWIATREMEAGGSNRRVVVVGGGLAGALLAKRLQFDANVVLIDSKEYYEIRRASSRCMVEPSFADRTLIPHTDYLANCRVTSSPAIDVTDTEVLTAEGRSFVYDYLVIATGHAVEHCATKTRKQRLEQFHQDNERIRSSSSVLIIGGGRTGVELAAEIAVDFPGKKVTLVHESSRLLQVLGPNASQKVLKWLKSKGVDVVLDQSIDVESIAEGDTSFTTSSGARITAACHFRCVGRPMGSSWLNKTVLNDKLDRFGRLAVDANLRVRGTKNIFAIGDITDAAGRSGSLAHQHAAVAAKNLKLLLKGGREEKLAMYKPSYSSPAVVSLGRRQAVVQLSFATIKGHIPGWLQSKDSYVAWNRRQMGLESETN